MDETNSGQPSRTPGQRPPIRQEMTVRQVAADYPAAREVFLRHGEPERDTARFGGLEPLDRFATRHGIPLSELLAELSQATGSPVDLKSGAARRAFRPFVAAALLVTLTLGAGWGALLLIQIGWEGSFTRAPVSAVVAHGEAQLWGFMALFVVGVSIGYLPSATARPYSSHWHARFLLSSILTGVLGGFVWALAPDSWGWLGPMSSTALVLGALGYLVHVASKLAGKWRTPWGRFILASAVWMVVWGVTDLGLHWKLSTEGPPGFSQQDRLLIIQLAIFGFALNSIYGFGQKLLPGLLRGGRTRPGFFAATWVMHNTGIIVLGLSHLAGLASMYWVGTSLIVIGGGVYLAGLPGLFHGRLPLARPEAGPGFLSRYIQLAFFWFLAGMALLLAGDLTQALRGITPPQAYLGATRHALTVGFMTTLILGVGQRLLPVLEHRLLAWPKLVVPIFVLIGVGNTLRVTLELATLAWTPAFMIIPISAILELSALSLFAFNIFQTLWPPQDQFYRTGRVTTMTPAALLLAEHPWLDEPLVDRGLRYLGRVRSVPAELTLGSLAAGEGHDPAATVDQINNMLAEYERRSAPD